jgi:hypothetical protein
MCLCVFSEARYGQLLAQYFSDPSKHVHRQAISSASKLVHESSLCTVWLYVFILFAGLFDAVCSEARYGQLLAPYLLDPSNLFIISSDFCHWGSRFKFTFTNSEQVRSK